MTAMPKSHLPAEERSDVLQLNGFSGLDRRGGIGADLLTEAVGLDTRFLPEVCTACTPRDMGCLVQNGEPLSLHCVGDDLLAFSNLSGMGFVTRIRPGEMPVSLSIGTAYASAERSVLFFSCYSKPLDPLNGSFTKSCIVYPDLFSFNPQAVNFSVQPYIPNTDNTPPELSHACVHLSRIFGTRDSRLFVSAYNEPYNFNLDTASDTGAANAWASTVQSGEMGDFTAATVFDGHPLMMREDATYVINNTKNPFRVAELLPVGACSAKSVGKTEGNLFFTAAREVYRYDGATLYPIGAPLGKSDFRDACGAAAGGRYYLALPDEDTVYVYDLQKNAWGALGRFTTAHVVWMAANARDCYFLTKDGHIYTTEGAEAGEFYFQTAPIPHGRMRPYRPLRLAAVYTAEEGSALTVSAKGADGQEIPLFSCEGDGATHARESRSYLPKEDCLSLTLRGHGGVRIHSLRLTAVDGE